ncbi:MAG: LysR substrate-binding domain-containing protein [Burkholderiales bacterium]
MMRVTMRQLQVFEAVARLKSYSRAAEEIHVAQPTVSKQIKLLQEEIGLPLIELIGKKVFLTQAGEELYSTCSAWLDSWGRFEQTIADLKGLKQGRLSIAAVTTTKYFMPRILGPFCSRYPGIDISLEVVNRDRLLERMAQNQDDLYVMGIPPEDIASQSEPFLDNPLVVLAPQFHPLAAKQHIQFSEIAGEQFILREHGSGTRLAIEKVFKERGFPLRVKMELGSNEAIKQAVAGGLGLAVLSKSTLNLDASQRDITILDVDGFPIKRSWYLVRSKDKQLSVVARTFMEFLKQHIDLLNPYGSR